MSDDDIVTAREVAEMIGMSTHWVLDQFQAEKLPGFKVGARVRFRRGDIREWLEARRRGPEPEGRQLRSVR